MDITPRDLTALTPAKLENLGTIFIDELVRRKLKINILNRFSNQVLWDLAFSILDVFKQRHEAGSDEVKREFEQIHLQIVRTLFPEILKAATIPFKFMPILEKMKPFVKLVRKGVRPKARRNEIIRDCLETNGLTDSAGLSVLTGTPSRVTQKRHLETIDRRRFRVAGPPPLEGKTNAEGIAYVDKCICPLRANAFVRNESGFLQMSRLFPGRFA